MKTQTVVTEATYQAVSPRHPHTPTVLGHGLSELLRDVLTMAATYPSYK